MSAFLDKTYLEGLVERAVEQFADEALAVVEHGLLDAKGLAWGDVEHKNDAEFAAWYVDAQSRGVIKALEVLPGGWAERWRRRFESVVGRVTEIAGVL